MSSTTLAILAIVGVVVWLLERQGVFAENTADRDLLVLEQLRKAGSDLAKAHAPEFFLYFPQEEPARRAGHALEAEEFSVRVQQSPGADGSWLCVATKPVVPTHGRMVEIRKRLTALATELGGAYDGWGTPVVK